jgi:uncharacterized protein
VTDENQRPWAKTPNGLVVTVRLIPKAGRDAIEGIEHLADGRCVIKARVRALPQNGEANGAVQKVLAATLGVSTRNVTLVGGPTSRVKRLRISGDTGVAIAALEQIWRTAKR